MYLSRLWSGSLLFFSSLLFLGAPLVVRAAACSIIADTVIDQAYVDAPENNCTSIDIQENVSTTWIGTVSLGGGVVTVKSGFTMTMGSSSEMVLGPMDDFVVESGATLTQVAEDPYGIRVTARNITVYGNISANGKGCSGSASGVGSGPGLATGVCTLGETGSGLDANGGAGYGGRGGASVSLGADVSATYGSSTYPDLLGSGGSSGGASASGGGLIHLSASGVLSVEGAISANGLTSSGGAGSGGSIYVRAATLTGSGSIQANGSNAGWCTYGGGGGGGRVAVYYGALGTFSLGNVRASAGVGDVCRGGSDGEKGTTYILDRLSYAPEASLRVTSGIDLASDFPSQYTNIVFDGGARIGCGDARSSLEIDSTGAFNDDGAVWTCSSVIPSVVVSSTGVATFTGTSLSFTNTDLFTFSALDFVNSGVSFSVPKAGSRGTLSVRNSALTLTGFTFTGAVHAGAVSADGGLLSLPLTTTLSLVNSDIFANVSTTLATLSIDASSSLNASGKGCPGPLVGAGFGPDLVTGVCALGESGAGLSPSGGAGYGGIGGSSSLESGPSLTYGSATYPYLLGSGGSMISGGGRILLSVTGTATINGTITADAAGGSGNSGGSGGSVNITANTIMGSGSISANGANAGWCGWGGGGGGGRVALRYQTLGTFDPSSVSVNGGSGDGCRGGASGGVGSIYTLLLNQSPSTPTSLGQAVLVNGSTTGTNNPVFTFDISDPDGADTEQYRIQIDNDPDFSSPVVDYTSALGAQGTRTFQVGQAIGGGTYTVGSSGQTLVDGAYYWQVQAIDVASAASAYALVNGGAIAFHVDTTIHSIQFAQSTASALESVTATSVRITLNTPHFETATVHYAITSGTATGGAEDYTLASGTATIDIGDTSATIPLVIVDDSVAEPSETLVITLSSPAFASLGSNTTHTYTILDNDTAGVTVSASSLSLTEGQSSDYTIVLTSAPTTTVTITPTVSGLASVSPASLSFSSLNWSTPQTVTVTATDDSIYQGTHSATVSHAMTTTAYGYDAITLGTVSVSITDNDSSGGGASTAGSGSAGSIAMPVTWSFTSPVIPPTAPVSSGPASTPSPSTESPAAPTVPPVPTPTPTPDAPVIFRAPPASVRVGDTLRFTYSYTNPSTRPQVVTIVRELVDSRGRVARTSRTTSTLRPGASFSRTVSERVTSRAGSYTERVRVLDGRGRSLSSSSFPVGVTVPVRGR